MEYELYVPTKYNASRPAPLMVTLHGLAVQPRDQIRFGYLTELAEERGYIVVAPMGYNDHGGYGVGEAGIRICRNQIRNPKPHELWRAGIR
jgi:poly(3-hydroxybutyrate) depolymerase